MVEPEKSNPSVPSATQTMWVFDLDNARPSPSRLSARAARAASASLGRTTDHFVIGVAHEHPETLVPPCPVPVQTVKHRIGEQGRERRPP